MYYPLGELYDRLTIFELKNERQVDWNNQGEIDNFKKAIKEYEEKFNIKPNISAYNNLKKINGEIWDLETDIRLGKEHLLGHEEVGKRSLKIRDLNDIRVTIKDYLNRCDLTNSDVNLGSSNHFIDSINNKHTKKLTNLFSPIAKDNRWIDTLYLRINREITGIKFEINLYFSLSVFIIFAISYLAAIDITIPKHLLFIVIALTIIFTIRSNIAQNKLKKNIKVISLIDTIKLSIDEVSLKEINLLISKLRDYIRKSQASCPNIINKNWLSYLLPYQKSLSVNSVLCVLIIFLALFTILNSWHGF